MKKSWFIIFKLFNFVKICTSNVDKIKLYSIQILSIFKFQLKRLTKNFIAYYQALLFVTIQKSIDHYQQNLEKDNLRNSEYNSYNSFKFLYISQSYK